MTTIVVCIVGTLIGIPFGIMIGLAAFPFLWDRYHHRDDLAIVRWLNR